MVPRAIFTLVFATATVWAQAVKPGGAAIPADVEVNADLVYATVGQRPLHLDLYMPKHTSGPLPAVILIHGGAWVRGNKSDLAFQAEYLAQHGFAAASIEWRLLPEVTYPGPIFDCKAAVRWLRAHASSYKIDPNRIGAAGVSAGGQLAGLLGTTIGLPKFEGDEGNTGVSSRVSAVALINPALDLADLATNGPARIKNGLIQYLNGSLADRPNVYRDASPTSHVNSKSVPALFMHGDADTTVPYHESTEMVQKLRAAGVRAELFTAHGQVHGFSDKPEWRVQTVKRMEEFFESTLKQGWDGNSPKTMKSEVDFVIHSPNVIAC